MSLSISKIHKILLNTYTEIISSPADLVRIRAVPSRIASLLLIQATAFLIEVVIELLDHGVVLQLAISGCVRGEIDICFILEKGVVPATIFL